MTCKHFGHCGGCSFWPADYLQELSQKESFVKDLFAFVEAPFFPIMPSPRTQSYRNKMEFTFRENLSKERHLGLMAKKNRVVSLEECGISPPWFIEAKHKIAKFWAQENIEAYFAPKDVGVLRCLMLREGLRTSQKMIVLIISPKTEFIWKKSLIETLESLLSSDDTVILRRQFTQKKVPTYFEDEILWGKGYIEEELQTKDRSCLKFKIKPASFFQPNTLQAERLYSKALELADLNKDDILYDLYCGTGTIGIFAAGLVKKVYGIESNQDAISDAQENLKNNGIENMEVLCCDVERATFTEKPNCIIVDPPRVGLSEKAMGQILGLQAKKIIYISCNPKTQVENVKTFIEKGYRVQCIQPVDQFPHTPHIENIVVLVS